MFEEVFEKLNHGDQSQFKRVVNNLLYRCYIVRRIYDRTMKMNKISPDYLFVEKNFDLISDYLSFMDMTLVKDDENGVCFLTSDDDTNKIRIDGVTTLIVYALRSYYEDKIKDNPSINEIYIDSTTLKLLLKDLGLTTVSRRISTISIASSLRALSMYNIVTLAKGSLSEPTYAVYILPSIRYVISNAKLNALYASINQGGEEETEENPDSLFGGVEKMDSSSGSSIEGDGGDFSNGGNE